MNSGEAKPELPQPWEDLHSDALFEADVGKMQRRIELAKHAILDRLEDANCAKNKESFRSGELLALRPAHRTRRVLEQLYFTEHGDEMIA